MKVITSIADEIDHFIATRQIGSYSLCQALDRLIRNHLSKHCHFSDFYGVGLCHTHSPPRLKLTDLLLTKQYASFKN